MATKRRKKHSNFLDRILYSADSRVFWVLLLVLISFSFAFTGQISSVLSPSPGSVVQTTVFDEPVTRGELQQLADNFEAVTRLVLRLGPRSFGSSLPFALYSFPTLQSGWALASDPVDYRVYLAEAERLGLRVSDRELGALRRRLWRWMKAYERAQSEVTAPDPRSRSFQVVTKQREIFDELEANRIFDVKDWKEKIRLLTDYHPTSFEEVLRDMLLLGKLSDYVRATVTVSDEEVYRRFVEQYQKRRASWVGLEATEDLEKAVRESFSEEELRSWLESHRDRFDKELALSARYLLIPRDHFEEQVKGDVRDEDLREAYRSDRDSYRRADIRADTSAFVLRTEEEMAAREEELYEPFEEVVDQVREKYIEETTDAKLKEFSEEIRKRLYPEDGTEGATLEALTSEYGFLRAGSVRPCSTEDAEEAFGEAYSPAAAALVRSALNAGEVDEKEKERLQQPKPLPDNEGNVFYVDVELHDAYRPELEDVREEVTDGAYREKLLELLSAAAEEKTEEIRAGSATLESLAGTEIAVEVGDGTAPARFSGLERAVQLVGRSDPLLVARKDDEGDPDPDGDGDDVEVGADGDDEDEDDTVVHDSSRAIRTQAFAIDAPGGVSVATDEDNVAVFIVRLEETVKPDPADFESRKNAIRNGLLRDRQNKYFQDWSRDLKLRAFPGALPEPAGDDVATAG